MIGDNSELKAQGSMPKEMINPLLFSSL